MTVRTHGLFILQGPRPTSQILSGIDRWMGKNAIDDGCYAQPVSMPEEEPARYGQDHNCHRSEQRRSCATRA